MVEWRQAVGVEKTCACRLTICFSEICQALLTRSTTTGGDNGIDTRRSGVHNFLMSQKVDVQAWNEIVSRGSSQR